MRSKIQKNNLITIVLALTLLTTSLLLSLYLNLIPSQNKLNNIPRPTISPNRSIGNTAAYNAIKKIADTEGLDAAWKYVITTYGQDNAKQIEAHDFAHYVGQLLFEKKGLTGITICTTDFAFGCYHGLLDRAFRDDLKSLSQAEKACRVVGPPKSGPYSSCIHGIGHGVASFYKDQDLNGALTTCDTLPEGAPQFCYDGVFMEFSRDALDDFYKPKDPIYPCDSVGPQYAYACGRNLPSVMMSRFHMSFEDIAKACQRSQVRDIRSSCFTALGFQTLYSSGSNTTEMIKLCETLNDREFEFECKSAAAGELIFQNMKNWQTDSPLICNSLTDPDQKRMCSEHSLSIQKNYSRN